MPSVGSVCSGIGGLDHGFANAGWSHEFLCEIDPWRRGVLAARFPGVPVYDDIRDVGREALANGGERIERDGGPSADAGRDMRAPGLDLVCGGTPCQDLSVAGRRAGLDGERSGLFFEFARVVDAFRPRWVLWENVPGAFSSNGGRDFGTVVGTLADVGYGLGWRVLDSRYFGVPQRRRRLFLVGALIDGDPRAAAERAGQVLAVGSRCPRHPATRGEARADVAGTLGGGAGERGWAQDTERMTFVASGGPDDGESETFVTGPLGGGNDGAGRRSKDDPNLVTQPYTFDWQAGGGGNDQSFRGKSRAWIDDKPGRARALTSNKTLAVHTPQTVRRLLPVECERLQALPDGWTQLGGTPDSRRYAGLGDAVTASVAEWIGRRLLEATS